MYIVQRYYGEDWRDVKEFANKEDAYTYLTQMNTKVEVFTRYRIILFQVMDEFVVEPAIRRVETVASEEPRAHQE